MKNINYNFKRLGLVYSLFLFAVVILSGCNKEEDSVPTNNTDPDKPVITETIGINGGSIEMDSLILIIPEGTLQTDCRLEVFVSEAEQSFKNIAVTRLYAIKGLPIDFTDSILIKLKYSRPLTDETFLCHGIQYYDEELDSTIITYDLKNFKDSSGYLIGYYKRPVNQYNIKKGSHKKTNSQPEPDIGEILDFFLGLDSYRTYETPVFSVRLKYPATIDPVIIQNYSAYLEEICWMFVNTGFNENVQGFILPLEIKFIDKRQEFPGSYLHYWANNWYIQFGNVEDEEMSFLRESTITEIFGQFLLNVYQYIGRAHYLYWLEFAAEKWFCRQHLNKTEVLKDDIELVFKGLHGSYSDNAYKGGAEVIEYLVRSYGILFLSKVYQEILKGSYEIDAISAVIQKPVNEWLPDFYKNFLRGEIHDVSGDMFDLLVFKDQEITSKLDFSDLNIQSRINADYRELSTKIFCFNTNDTRINESSKVYLRVASGEVSSDHFKLLIFAYQRFTHEILFINEGTELTITDTKDYMDDGYDVLAVVVNCYYSKDFTAQAENRTNLSLFVELHNIEILNIPICTIMLGGVDVNYKIDEGTTLFVKNESFSFTNGYKMNGEIAYFNDTTYTAAWDYYDDECHYWGDIKIIINPETYLMKSIDFRQNERVIDTDKGYDWKIESRFQGGYILLDSNMKFRADQDDISGYLINFEYRRESYTQDKTLVTEVDELIMNENSYLDIHL